MNRQHEVKENHGQGRLRPT